MAAELPGRGPAGDALARFVTTDRSVQRHPRVSVGVPVFNGERYLEEALNSLLDQSYEDFELLISDDGSTDRTPEIVRELKLRDPRITFERTDENRGASWNFNNVVEMSSGEFFRWACHDDLAHREHLATCVAALDEHPAAALVFTETEVIDAAGEVLGTRIEDIESVGMRAHQRLAATYRRLSYADPLFGLIRRSALDQTKLIGAYESADLVLLAELALAGEFVSLPGALFVRRHHPNMSRAANPTRESIARWFDRNNRQRFYLPRSRLLREHSRAIRHARLNRADRSRCLRMLATVWLPRNARGLVRDYLELFQPARSGLSKSPDKRLHVTQ